MSASYLAEAGRRIKEHRFTAATLRLRKPDGSALANAEITVEQTAHSFLFGATGGYLLPKVIQMKGWDEAKVTEYQERIKELCNAVTLPFYWGRFEPEEGQPHTEALLTAALWYKENGFTVKGHPLCWHSACADWLLGYSNKEIYEKQRARVRRDVGAFKGLIDMWDVINEVVIMPVFDKYDNAVTRIAKEYGPRNLADTLFRDARETNPTASLILNDFILNKDYEDLVEALLGRGTPLDIIGLQTHQHQGYRGADTIWDYAERFSRFNLPLHFTENTIVSGEFMPAHYEDLNDYKRDDWLTDPAGEERQCREAVEFYTLVYSHPAVHSVTWWDFVDGGWLNAPSGLLRRDLSEKPIYLALKKLIKGEWWTGKTPLKTDSQGCVRFEGALGDYSLKAADAHTGFCLKKGVPNIDIKF